MVVSVVWTVVWLVLYLGAGYPEDAPWTEGQCEIVEGVIKEVLTERGTFFAQSFSTNFYHSRSDIHSPLQAMSNHWGWWESGSLDRGAAELLRQAVIDCCPSQAQRNSTADPLGRPAKYWADTLYGSPPCAATPSCSTSMMRSIQTQLLGESYGCSLCSDCCSSMRYTADANSSTGYSRGEIGSYKRRPCYVRTQVFDEYVDDPDYEDSDISEIYEGRGNMLWLRLAPQESYDYYKDPTGYEARSREQNKLVWQWLTCGFLLDCVLGCCLRLYADNGGHSGRRP